MLPLPNNRAKSSPVLSLTGIDVPKDQTKSSTSPDL
jgi:hypothetical protein